jgi:2-iminobutanoate/2-iminopropanoate deaminase
MSRRIQYISGKEKQSLEDHAGPDRHSCFFTKPQKENMKKIIHAPQAPAPIGPYSQAVLSGNTLYCSGQIALDAHTGNLIQGTIEEETKKVMENLKAVLAAADMDFSHIVKCSIFIKDMDQFGAINGVYARYFESDPPARETVQVSRLPKDVAVEISCVAVR